MQQDSEPRKSQENLNNNLSQYDKEMTQKYQNQISNETLVIAYNQQLKSLDFIQYMNVNELKLSDCKNIVPKLQSYTIKQLIVKDCKILSVKDLQLEKLEVLKLLNYFQKEESETLTFEIIKFQKLKELILSGCLNIDINPLSQMTGLNVLTLNNCDLHSTEALGPLVNLLQLNLGRNKGIDITSLQRLTQLTELWLWGCNLISLDALRPLTNLQKLYIFENKIVYLQPLIELKLLSELDARCNSIVDSQTIEQLPNFVLLGLKDQKQPTQLQLTEANILRSINFPITSLKLINGQQTYLRSQNSIFTKNITQFIQKQNLNHQLFIARAAAIFKQMNELESCQ
ncbi:DUF2252_family protein [Hexamita inflata]|uniref:DUF2252_family protein n=1 Tax=Hexamita inflata TaxID=28002 RepID=A0ABP1HBX9_9EUKA